MRTVVRYFLEVKQEKCLLLTGSVWELRAMAIPFFSKYSRPEASLHEEKKKGALYNNTSAYFRHIHIVANSTSHTYCSVVISILAKCTPMHPILSLVFNQRDETRRALTRLRSTNSSKGGLPSDSPLWSVLYMYISIQFGFTEKPSSKASFPSRLTSYCFMG